MCIRDSRETRSPDDYELFLEYLLEAPRGQRQVFENGKYKAAYKNDPSYQRFPCADPLPREPRPRRLGNRCDEGCVGEGTCSPSLAPTTPMPNTTLPPMPQGPAVMPTSVGDPPRTSAILEQPVTAPRAVVEPMTKSEPPAGFRVVPRPVIPPPAGENDAPY
ncbi:MAG: hypothetical protein N2039_02115, partial [Gemmataceae bacterium]|nr:hypothetical protein [Gemmataceae bacterium]